MKHQAPARRLRALLLALPIFLIAIGLTFYNVLPRDVRDVLAWLLGTNPGALDPVARPLAVLFFVADVGLLLGLSALMLIAHLTKVVGDMAQASLQAAVLLDRHIDVTQGMLPFARDRAERGEPRDEARTIVHRVEALPVGSGREVPPRLREIEAQLRGEQRFAVYLIAAVLLGVVAVFAGMVPFLHW